MRHMVFTTPFANHQMIKRQAVMRPAAVAAAARHFPFWQRTHAVNSSTISPGTGRTNSAAATTGCIIGRAANTCQGANSTVGGVKVVASAERHV